MKFSECAAAFKSLRKKLSSTLPANNDVTKDINKKIQWIRMYFVQKKEMLEENNEPDGENILMTAVIERSLAILGNKDTLNEKEADEILTHLTSIQNQVEATNTSDNVSATHLHSVPNSTYSATSEKADPKKTFSKKAKPGSPSRVGSSSAENLSSSAPIPHGRSSPTYSVPNAEEENNGEYEDNDAEEVAAEQTGSEDTHTPKIPTGSSGTTGGKRKIPSAAGSNPAPLKKSRTARSGGSRTFTRNTSEGPQVVQLKEGAYHPDDLPKDIKFILDTAIAMSPNKHQYEDEYYDTRVVNMFFNKKKVSTTLKAKIYGMAEEYWRFVKAKDTKEQGKAINFFEKAMDIVTGMPDDNLEVGKFDAYVPVVDNNGDPIYDRHGDLETELSFERADEIERENEVKVDNLVKILNKKFKGQPDYVTNSYASIAREHYLLYHKTIRNEEVTSNDVAAVKCFVSSPGMAKTVQIGAVAETLRAPLVRLDMSGKGVSDICGVPKEYSNPREGILGSAILGIEPAKNDLREKGIEPDENSPIILFLDELDKLEPEAFMAMMDLMDSNRDYVEDKCLAAMLPKSGFKIVAAANDWSKVHPIVKSRLNMVHIPDYSFEQKQSIVKNVQAPSLLADVKGVIDFQDDAVTYLVKEFVTEGGVRESDSVLKDISRMVREDIYSNPENQQLKKVLHAEGQLKGRFDNFHKELVKVFAEGEVFKEGELDWWPDEPNVQDIDDEDIISKMQGLLKEKNDGLGDDDSSKVAEAALNDLDRKYKSLMRSLEERNKQRKRIDSGQIQRLKIDVAYLKSLSLSPPAYTEKKFYNKKIEDRIRQQLQENFPNLTDDEDIYKAIDFFKRTYVPSLDYDPKPDEASLDEQFSERERLIDDYFELMKRDNVDASVDSYQSFNNEVFGHGDDAVGDGILGNLERADKKLTDFRNDRVFQQHRGRLSKIFADEEAVAREFTAKVIMGSRNNNYVDWLTDSILERVCVQEGDPRATLSEIMKSPYGEAKTRVELYNIYLAEMEREGVKRRFRKGLNQEYSPAANDPSEASKGLGFSIPTSSGYTSSYGQYGPESSSNQNLNVGLNHQSLRDDFSYTGESGKHSDYTDFVNANKQGFRDNIHFARAQKAKWKTSTEYSSNTITQTEWENFKHRIKEHNDRKHHAKAKSFLQENLKDISSATDVENRHVNYGELRPSTKDSSSFISRAQRSSHKHMSVGHTDRDGKLLRNWDSADQKFEDDKIKHIIRQDIEVRDALGGNGAIEVLSQGVVGARSTSAFNFEFSQRDPDPDVLEQVVEHLSEKGNQLFESTGVPAIFEIGGAGGNLKALLDCARDVLGSIKVKNGKPSMSIEYTDEPTKRMVAEVSKLMQHGDLNDQHLIDLKVPRDKVSDYRSILDEVVRLDRARASLRYEH